MKGYWTDTRPNGQPVEPGTVCFVTDLEDGSHPIPTYGKTTEEVLQKLAMQNANAQLEIARRSAVKAPTSSPAPPPLPRRVISPDQVMRATEDLSDPAKAPQAVSTLFESATGISPQRLILQNFATLADEWEKGTPDFYPHNGNRRLICAEAAQLAGGLAQVTIEHLDRAFTNLRARGDLFDAPATDPNHEPSPAFPDESRRSAPAERPRPRFATSTRSNVFRSQAPTRTPKYTEEELRTMPMSKSRRLIETNDKEYADAMEFYFGAGSSAQARA